MRSVLPLSVAIPALLATAAASGALAQLAPPSARPPAKAPAAAKSSTKFSSDQPVDVSSDHAELQNRADRAVLTGNVRVRQGDLGLDAPRVNIAFVKAVGGGDPQIQRLDASGGVLLTRPDETARSQYAIYDVDRRIVTMIGAVVLNRNDNVVHGQRLVYDLDSGHATVDGGAVPGKAGVTTTSAGRVTGRFTVPKRTDQAAAPAPAKPAGK